MNHKEMSEVSARMRDVSWTTTASVAKESAKQSTFYEEITKCKWKTKCDWRDWVVANTGNQQGCNTIIICEELQKIASDMSVVAVTYQQFYYKWMHPYVFRISIKHKTTCSLKTKFCLTKYWYCVTGNGIRSTFLY